MWAAGLLGPNLVPSYSIRLWNCPKLNDCVCTLILWHQSTTTHTGSWMVRTEFQGSAVLITFRPIWPSLVLNSILAGLDFWVPLLGSSLAGCSKSCRRRRTAARRTRPRSRAESGGRCTSFPGRPLGAAARRSVFNFQTKFWNSGLVQSKVRRRRVYRRLGTPAKKVH